MDKRIAILCSGGDAPGMNKALYTIARQAIKNCIKPYVVIEGYQGLYENKIYPADLTILETNANHSGSIIYSSRFDGFKNDLNVVLKCVENLKQQNIDTVFVLGGNGSLQGARVLSSHGIKVFGLPCTIDNDVMHTDYTIGFDSALNAICDVIDNLKYTANSHGNIYLVEIMGRECSDLTIAASYASMVDYVVTPDNILEIDDYLKIINHYKNINRRSIIFLITEKIYDGIENINLQTIKAKIAAATGMNTKIHIIGFVQRGATPTAIDRYNAARLAAFAFEQYLNNNNNLYVGIEGSNLVVNKLDDNRDLNKKNNKEKNNEKINLINFCKPIICN